MNWEICINCGESIDKDQRKYISRGSRNGPIIQFHYSCIMRLCRAFHEYEEMRMNREKDRHVYEL